MTARVILLVAAMVCVTALAVTVLFVRDDPAPPPVSHSYYPPSGQG